MRARDLRLWLPALLSCLACSHARTVDLGITTVQHRLERVLSAGGYYCAPRELALARAHLEFARAGLAQGNPAEADSQLKVAALNAHAAERLSPVARCAAAGSTVVVEKPKTEGPDADADGIADAADACPREAEDEDGYQDADGCPEADNDQDGVADAADRCPLEPGPPASAGCPRPEYPDVELTARALRIARPILFGDDVPAIRSVSFGLLDSVVAALNDHPEVRLEIQGHTDSLGDDSHNLKLSQLRAEAVRRYLTEHGIEPSRLTARGYGETRPIESNLTSQGREINRRIEFVRADVEP